MDENHQDKTENNLTTTRNALWLPPLSLKDQKKLKYLQKKPFAVRIGFQGKTLWDWLQLVGILAIPLVVAGATLLFGIQQAHLADLQHQSDQRIAQQQHEADQQQALDQQRAAILQTYIDNIQDLLLHDNLLKSKPTDDVAILARARTLTALQGLDPGRKGSLVQFLYEAQLIGFQGDKTDKFKPHDKIIDLSLANISGANISDFILNSANLPGANLPGADFSGANLSYATYLTQHQLDQVSSCKGAILPKGLTCHHNQ